jgi:hypothetical protein
MLKLEITRHQDSLILQIPKISPDYKTLVYSPDLPTIKVTIDPYSFSPTKKNSEKIQKQIPLDEQEVDLCSQAIEFVNYLPKEKALIVNFWQNQGCYLFYNIPETLYALFLIAESKGTFFHKVIQKKYQFKKIPPEFTVLDVKEAIGQEQAEAAEEVSLNMKEIYNQVSSPETLLSYWNQALTTPEKVQLLQNPQFPILRVLEEIKADFWLAKALFALPENRVPTAVIEEIRGIYQGNQLICTPILKKETISIIVPQYAALCTHKSGLPTIPEFAIESKPTLKKGQALMKMDPEGNLELVDIKLNW